MNDAIDPRRARGGRAIVPHIDDLGASHGANAAFCELAAAGLVTCGSVMVPGPWFREVAEAAAANPLLDVGVHLTLTSEWQGCRWGPISTRSRTSGLIDADGYFWADVESLRAHFVAEAAALELRAQVERAVGAGFAPTHLDAHMGAAMLPELLPVQISLGRELGLPPILPRSIGWALDPEAYRHCVAALAEAGAPVVDHCRGTLPVAAEGLAACWEKVFLELPEGLTHLALHCTAPGDFAAMAPAHAQWRFQEYELVRAGGLRMLSEAAGIGIASTRDLQRQWRTWLADTDTARGGDKATH